MFANRDFVGLSLRGQWSGVLVGGGGCTCETSGLLREIWRARKEGKVVREVRIWRCGDEKGEDKKW